MFEKLQKYSLKKVILRKFSGFKIISRSIFPEKWIKCVESTVNKKTDIFTPPFPQNKSFVPAGEPQRPTSIKKK